MTPKERLANDILVECAVELKQRVAEVEELKFENALLKARLRVMELRATRAQGAPPFFGELAHDR